jgi:hypothetical protein
VEAEVSSDAANWNAPAPQLPLPLHVMQVPVDATEVLLLRTMKRTMSPGPVSVMAPVEAALDVPAAP